MYSSDNMRRPYILPPERYQSCKFKTQIQQMDFAFDRNRQTTKET